MKNTSLLLLYFNSIKVRLELRFTATVTLRDGNFNSIKVRLERYFQALGNLRQSHFNSIKVRLEHLFVDCLQLHQSFQFHKGAIRTLLSTQKFLSKTYFNSIKVRLELLSPMIERSRVADFNSIKVRLELFSRSGMPTQHLFQFHKGAIRTHSKVMLVANAQISIP